MRIAFMGTPDFSVPCLRALVQAGHEVVGVFCQPDKPVGRKQELKAPPVKAAALALSLPVVQPKSLRGGEGVRLLEPMAPDLVIVVAYGKILPPDVLAFPKYGCVNIHASILPKYRGASPIHWAVLNGERETGVTSMQMDEGMDTGDILLCETTPIGENETTEDLFERLSTLGAELMLKTIAQLEAGTLQPKPQDHSQATTVGLLTKEMSTVDWAADAQTIHNKIRGLYSWPGASTTLDGKLLKLHSSRMTDKTSRGQPGEVVCSDGKLLVCCGDGRCVELLEVQPEGKKRMPAAAFLNGRRIPAGTILGQ
ncbi:MAG: methionyl-tRNA formyltransferase [Clostridia bacterium]|nr:methionyl-tRNA formyltransferase [Clostridia bacterium]